MVVLGLDLSLNGTGWAVVKYEGSKMSLVDCGLIKVKVKSHYFEKIKTIGDKISQLFNDYEITKAALESSFIGKNASTALKLGMVRGMVIYICSSNNSDIMDISPKEIKKAVVGTGSADKSQVAFMVQKILSINTEFESDDVSDAVAVAISAISMS